jgi:hypothetical protein
MSAIKLLAPQNARKLHNEELRDLYPSPSFIIATIPVLLP